MAWVISQASVDFSQNKAIVNFVDSGSSSVNPRNIDVQFSVTNPGQPVPKNVDFNGLIAQAKQILTDATKNAPDITAIVRRGPKR